ncbi:MAG TPA: ESX secretion-associated protein EspG [Pseudonocardiaceae bacterium]|jgi:hypothetical protein|nr:ESX secretion-associated protein EspG [Pseudonocardiaceae bacterium]
MLGNDVTLPASALTLMLRVQQLTEEPHPTLAGAPMWTSTDEDHNANRQMWSIFERLGLVDRRGQLDGGAFRTLAILARPSVEYYAWLYHHGRQRELHAAVLVAALGDEIAVAYRDEDTDMVELSSLRHESLPETLVRQLPQVPPARIDALNLRRSDLAASDDTSDLFWQPGDSHTADPGKLRSLAEQSLIGTGELYVCVHDHAGRPSRTTEPIVYRDTRAGRAIIVCSAEHISIAPATPALLADRLRAAQHQLGH